MSTSIITQSKQDKHNNNEAQAQDLMREYFQLPVDLQKLYANIAKPVAQVAFGKRENNDR
jgi:hypothetical protein